MIEHILRYCLTDQMMTAELPRLALSENIVDPQAARWVCMGVLTDVVSTGRITAGRFDSSGDFEPVAPEPWKVLEACLSDWGTAVGDWPEPFELWLACTPRGRDEGERLVGARGNWFDEPAEFREFPTFREEITSLDDTFDRLALPPGASNLPARRVAVELSEDLGVPQEWGDHLLVGFTADRILRGEGPLRLLAPTAADSAPSWGERSLAVGHLAFGLGDVDGLVYGFAVP